MKPIVQALLVADHVYTDQQSGKKVVCGIFHKLRYRDPTQAITKLDGDEGKAVVHVPAGGFRAGSPFCYISLTSVHASQAFELRYVDLAEDKPLFGLEFNVKCDDPLSSIEIVFPLPPLPHYNKPGNFALELLWNNEPLGLHRIAVEELKEGPPNVS